MTKDAKIRELQRELEDERYRHDRLQDYCVALGKELEEAKAKPKPKSMTRAEILDAALRCVNGDREQDYGGPEYSFLTIANLWTIYLAAEGKIYEEENTLTPRDVAAMMALLKIARIATGHAKADNWIDLAGYAACGGEIDTK